MTTDQIIILVAAIAGGFFAGLGFGINIHQKADKKIETKKKKTK